MSYDDWKSTDPRDADFEPVCYEMTEEEAASWDLYVHGDFTTRPTEPAPANDAECEPSEVPF